MTATDSDNVKSCIQNIANIIEDSQTNMREYKKEIDLLRQEIALMENHLAT